MLLVFALLFLLISLNLKLNLICISFFCLLSLSLSLPSVLEDQSGLRIKFAALTLCDKMSSKTSRAWIIMPVILRSLAPHLLRCGAHCFGIWEPSDVNLAAGTEGNRFTDIMGHLGLCWHRISDSHRQTDGWTEMLILYLIMF